MLLKASRPDWHRGQNSGIGLKMASPSSFWSRSRPHWHQGTWP